MQNLKKGRNAKSRQGKRIKDKSESIKKEVEQIYASEMGGICLIIEVSSGVPLRSG